MAAGQRPDDVAGRSRADGRPSGGIFLALLCALLATGFVALGVWQVERRSWKLDLIERIGQRVHAAPGAPPGPAEWPGINARNDEYRRVRASGRFLPASDTLVKAVTEIGAGFWVLSPLRTDAGFVLLVNRGFVTAPGRGAPPPAGEVEVTGLLRMTEPKGGFLRANDPATGHWFSRDVQAIAAARQIGGSVAPYFVDAEAEPGFTPPGGPVGGLTVLRLPNNHLVYALTWFALAAMSTAAAWRLAGDARRRLRARGEAL